MKKTQAQLKAEILALSQALDEVHAGMDERIKVLMRLKAAREELGRLELPDEITNHTPRKLSHRCN